MQKIFVNLAIGPILSTLMRRDLHRFTTEVGSSCRKIGQTSTMYEIGPGRTFDNFEVIGHHSTRDQEVLSLQCHISESLENIVSEIDVPLVVSDRYPAQPRLNVVTPQIATPRQQCEAMARPVRHITSQRWLLTETTYLSPYRSRDYVPG